MAMGPLRDLGPCEVWYGATPAKIGENFGTVSCRYSQEDAAVFEGAFGNTPVDCIIMGSGPFEVTVPFTRLTIADLAIVLPGGSRSNLGSTSGNIEVISNALIGTSEYDNAVQLIIKPIMDGTVAPNGNWLHVPKAYPRADYDISYDTSGQRIFNTVFKGFPNASSGLMWHIGKL